MSKRVKWWRGSKRGSKAGKAAAITGCLAVLAMLLGVRPVAATTIEALLTPFAGSGVEARIVLDDAAANLGAGEILVTVEITEGSADIRGVFLDLALDPTDLSGLSATGDYVTSFAYASVINLGGGSNLHGGGSPCPCDFGVEIGTPGAGKDDIQEVSFVLAHDSLSLTLSMFFEQSVGVRTTGSDLGPRQGGGGAKLSGTLPIPEPSTSMLLGLGLCAMSLHARRRM
jgi:hypothetical protein